MNRRSFLKLVGLSVVAPSMPRDDDCFDLARLQDDNDKHTLWLATFDEIGNIRSMYPKELKDV